MQDVFFYVIKLFCFDLVFHFVSIKPADDLSGTIGEPKTLFTATQAPWVWNMQESLPNGKYDGYVTDGPWFYRTRSGKLQMIWSSFGEKRYAIGIAESDMRPNVVTRNLAAKVTLLKREASFEILGGGGGMSEDTRPMQMINPPTVQRHPRVAIPGDDPIQPGQRLTS